MAKIKLRLRAKVVIDEEKDRARLVFDNPSYYRQQVDQFRGEKYVYVTIENQRSQRSPAQNRYWWGVCYPIIAETTGYTVNEVHEWAKRKFLKPRIVDIGGEEVVITRSTTELSKGEAVEYTDELRQFSEEVLGAHIPTPEEAGYENPKFYR